MKLTSIFIKYLKPDEIFMVLFVGIDVYHYVPDIRETFEDEPFDFCSNFVRPLHRHHGIHVQLQIDDQILAGSSAPDTTALG
jgi:hypothetical protein